MTRSVGSRSRPSEGLRCYVRLFVTEQVSVLDNRRGLFGNHFLPSGFGGLNWGRTPEAGAPVIAMIHAGRTCVHTRWRLPGVFTRLSERILAALMTSSLRRQISADS
jgi:hypothetical protein